MLQCVDTIMEHGGARPGAGRPSKTENAQASDAIVARKLRGGAELGWEVLAERYPSIMRAAIELAMGDETHPPDKGMLKTLLELMPKVVGADKGTDDSPIAQLIKDMRVRITAESQ